VDAVLVRKVAEFVERGDFALVSGLKPDASYDRLWFAEPIDPEEIAFDEGVSLLTKARAKALKGDKEKPSPKPGPEPDRKPDVGGAAASGEGGD